MTGSPPDQVLFAWEDVKAMFNGGSRKRAGKPSDAELGQQVVTDDPAAKVSIKTNKSSAKKMKMQQQPINDPEGQIAAAASTSAPLNPPQLSNTTSCPVVVAPAVAIPHPAYCQPSLLLAKLNSLNSGIIKSSIDSSSSSTSSTAIDINHYAWNSPQLSGRFSAAASSWPAGYFMPPFMHSAYSYYSYLMSNQLQQQQQQQLQPIVKLSGGGGIVGSEDDEPFVDVESP